jgi:GAF domain-containing protein
MSTDLAAQAADIFGADTQARTEEELRSSINQVFQQILTQMRMNVVFISEFTGGRRVFRHVAQSEGVNLISEGGGDPLDVSWCQRVVDGRLPQYIPDAKLDPVAVPLLEGLPFPIGTHISTPLTLSNGEVYGTLCTFSLEPHGSPDQAYLVKLKLIAKMAASRIESLMQRNPSR